LVLTGINTKIIVSTYTGFSWEPFGKCNYPRLSICMHSYWSHEAEELARDIGRNIEDQRLASGETVSKYCYRLNISRATYLRLKKGNPGVAAGALFEWCVLTGNGFSLIKVFQVENLFDLPRTNKGEFKKRVRK